MNVETAALTRDAFRKWPLAEREAYLKEHPKSKFQYHFQLERKKIKVPDEVPKLGTNWNQHKFFPDPDHHRRHAKAHRIAHDHLIGLADNMKPRSKEGKAKQAALYEQAATRAKWARRHQKCYEALADHVLS